MSNMSINSTLDAFHARKSTLVTTKINNKKKKQRLSNILEEVLCKVMGTDWTNYATVGIGKRNPT